MRISDWSSDVCSSDLRLHRHAQRLLHVLEERAEGGLQRRGRFGRDDAEVELLGHLGLGGGRPQGGGQREAGGGCGHGFQHLGLPYRSEEHTSELQSLMRISYAVFCLKKKKTIESMY